MPRMSLTLSQAFFAYIIADVEYSIQSLSLTTINAIRPTTTFAIIVLDILYLI